ncbi:hypothetical protein KXX11_004007, partial [Aspergillus fumigatus]
MRVFPHEPRRGAPPHWEPYTARPPMPPTTPTAAPGTAPSTPATGLLLTGGGARAAYQ